MFSWFFISKKDRQKTFATVLLLFLVLPLLTSCADNGLIELAREMAIEWAEEKDLISKDGQGNINVNYGQIAWYQVQRAGNSLTSAGYTTGDRALDAALDIAPIARSIREADTLANIGLQMHMPDKLDEAIEKRKDDWAYHDYKAAILAYNGDPEGAAEEMAKSDDILARRISNEGNAKALKLNQLRAREHALEDQLRSSPSNPTLRSLLADAQTDIANLTSE